MEMEEYKDSLFPPNIWNKPSTAASPGFSSKMQTPKNSVLVKSDASCLGLAWGHKMQLSPDNFPHLS